MHIVIARYNESLDWLTNCLSPAQRLSVWIYNKGTDVVNVPGVPLSQVKNLQNVGRESHTYLTHIIENWDNLPSIIYFLQAEPFVHFPPNFCCVPETTQFIIKLWKKEIEKYGSTRWYSLDIDFEDFHEKNCEQSQFTFREWFEKNTGQKFKPPHLWWIGACFGISHNRVKSRTREYYEELRNQLISLKPEVAYYLERSWFYVFTDKNQ
jgi:hypothetical protein